MATARDNGKEPRITRIDADERQRQRRRVRGREYGPANGRGVGCGCFGGAARQEPRCRIRGPAAAGSPAHAYLLFPGRRMSCTPAKWAYHAQSGLLRSRACGIARQPAAPKRRRPICIRKRSPMPPAQSPIELHDSVSCNSIPRSPLFPPAPGLFPVNRDLSLIE